MFCAFCRTDPRLDDARRFQHFFLYCLKDGDRFDSLTAMAEHMRDRRETRRCMAVFCGECGRTFRKMRSLLNHVNKVDGFHLRKSTIVGYAKHSFNPFMDVHPLPEIQSLTASIVARTSHSGVSSTSGVVLTSTASVLTGASVVTDDGDLTTDQHSLTSLTSVLVPGDITVPHVISAQDVSVPPVAVMALAGSDVR